MPSAIGSVAEDRREGRHHDRAEAQQRGLADRGLRRQADPAALEREVDHHDRVLLHDADQHDDADHGDDRQVHAEHHQDDQRADARRRQAGNDRDRVDEAFVEDAEHHVGREYRSQHQDALPLERIPGIPARRPGNWSRSSAGRLQLALDLPDGIARLAEREAGRKIEGDRHRRLLALVVDLQRSDRRDDPGHRRQRHHRTGQRTNAADAAARRGWRALRRDAGSAGLIHVGLEENLRQPGRIGLEFRQALQDHLVVVGGREDRRHLPACRRR